MHRLNLQAERPWLAVATYPSAGGQRVTRGMRFPRKEYARSRHQCLFEKNVRKTGKDVVYEFWVKGSGVVFTHGEGISTPHVRHKRRQTLIQCANVTSIYIIFPFLRSYVFLCLFFYLFVVDKGVSLAPTYSSIVIRKSDLHSSLRTKRWLNYFDPFFARYILIEWKVI